MMERIARTLATVGILLVIGAAGSNDTGTPLAVSALWALLGMILVFAGAVLHRAAPDIKHKQLKSIDSKKVTDWRKSA